MTPTLKKFYCYLWLCRITQNNLRIIRTHFRTNLIVGEIVRISKNENVGKDACLGIRLIRSRQSWKWDQYLSTTTKMDILIFLNSIAGIQVSFPPTPVRAIEPTIWHGHFLSEKGLEKCIKTMQRFLCFFFIAVSLGRPGEFQRDLGRPGEL